MPRTIEELQSFAKQLTENATKSELKLHKQLTNAGIPFKFQYIINFYIVDFLINENLIIELDSPRFHNVAYDRRRDEYLKSLGFFILRIKSYRVFKDLKNVMDEILKSINQS